MRKCLESISNARVHGFCGGSKDLGGNVIRDLVRWCSLSYISDCKQFIMTSPKHITKSSEYDAVKNWLGDGLIMSKGSYKRTVISSGNLIITCFLGNKWMSRRKVLTPAFHFKVLDQFIEVFDRNSNILVEILGKCQETDAVDIYPLITMAALDIICGKWVEFSLSSP